MQIKQQGEKLRLLKTTKGNLYQMNETYVKQQDKQISELETVFQDLRKKVESYVKKYKALEQNALKNYAN